MSEEKMLTPADPPRLEAWFNNIAVILISAMGAFMVTVATVSSMIGASRLQIEINTRQLAQQRDVIDRLMILPQQIKELADSDMRQIAANDRQIVEVNRHLEAIDAKIDKLIEQERARR
jgi:hypothetical protein